MGGDEIVRIGSRIRHDQVRGFGNVAPRVWVHGFLRRRWKNNCKIMCLVLICLEEYVLEVRLSCFGVIFGFSPTTEMLRRVHGYGVATVSSIDKIIGLFCRISSLL